MTTRVYTLPVEQTRWNVPGGAETVFNWEYDEGRDKLLNLYEKGKNKQWNSRERIDWSTEVDKDNPIGGPEVYAVLVGSDKPHLVAVSALGSDRTQWNPIVARLTTRPRLISYDRPGIGRS